jgi:hypothetical protein
VLVGGVLLVALHGVSDVGIYGLLGGKIAAYAAQHDQGVSYISPEEPRRGLIAMQARAG